MYVVCTEREGPINNGTGQEGNEKGRGKIEENITKWEKRENLVLGELEQLLQTRVDDNTFRLFCDRGVVVIEQRLYLRLFETLQVHDLSYGRKKV